MKTKKSERVRLLETAVEIARIKGFEEGFDTAKEMYSKYVLLPKCYVCANVGDESYIHTFGTEPACREHSNATARYKQMIEEFNNI